MRQTVNGSSTLLKSIHINPRNPHTSHGRPAALSTQSGGHPSCTPQPALPDASISWGCSPRSHMCLRGKGITPAFKKKRQLNRVSSNVGEVSQGAGAKNKREIQRYERAKMLYLQVPIGCLLVSASRSRGTRPGQTIEQRKQIRVMPPKFNDKTSKFENNRFRPLCTSHLFS